MKIEDYTLGAYFALFFPEERMFSTLEELREIVKEMKKMEKANDIRPR